MSQKNTSFKGSELRQDPITEKWVVIATTRSKRPEEIAGVLKNGKKSAVVRDAKCVFCDVEKNPQEKETLFLPDEKNWRVRVFPNKYPAFLQKEQIGQRTEGIYRAVEGVGFHEVVTARDHNDFWHRAEDDDLMNFLKALRDRYLFFSKKPAVNYIQIIENHGKEAGASQEHVHAQIFAMPVVPSGEEVMDNLLGNEKYFSEKKRCGFCDIISQEKEKAGLSRVVFENELFIVLVPFAPRFPFEQWILPRHHHAGFEKLSNLELPLLGRAIQKAAQALFKGLNDPAYNLFLYSSPCDDIGSYYPIDRFKNFHWHWRLTPRINTWGGFEMATGMEITSSLPEEAAEYLRKQLNK